MRSTVSRAVIAAPFAALLLVGCSGGGDTAAPAAPAASGEQADAGDAAEPTVYEDLESLSQAISDQQAEDGTQRFDIESEGPSSETGEGPGNGTGEISVADDGVVSTRLVVDGGPEAGGEQLEIITLPDALYVNTGEELEPGKPWIRIVPGAEDPFSQLFGSIVGVINSAANPLGAFDDASDAFTLTGSTQEDRDGAAVVVYTIEVDTAAVLSSGLGGQDAITPEGIPATAVATYVVDANNRVLETVVTSGEGAEADTTTATFSGWGEPVDVAVPADDQIASTEGLGG